MVLNTNEDFQTDIVLSFPSVYSVSLSICLSQFGNFFYFLLIGAKGIQSFYSLTNLLLFTKMVICNKTKILTTLIVTDCLRKIKKMKN